MEFGEPMPQFAFSRRGGEMKVVGAGECFLHGDRDPIWIYEEIQVNGTAHSVFGSDRPGLA
jgi:hypothetical protein